MLASGILGLFGFGLAVLTLHLAAIPLGNWAALALGLAVSIAWNLMLFLTRKRKSSGSRMTEQFFLLGLLLKIVMTATIVVTATIIVERTGPFIGALIAALPTAAGAVYIILALEHAPAFIAGSAVGSMASNASGTLFAFTYALLAQRRGLLVSIIGAFAVWFFCAGSAAAGELDAGERARPQCDCDRRAPSLRAARFASKASRRK